MAESPYHVIVDGVESYHKLLCDSPPPSIRWAARERCRQMTTAIFHPFILSEKKLRIINPHWELAEMQIDVSDTRTVKSEAQQLWGKTFNS